MTNHNQKGFYLKLVAAMAGSAIACSSFAAGPSMSNDARTTPNTSKKYICIGQAVHLTISGENHAPNACCADQTTPVYDTTVYTWTAGATGSSSSATLDTSAAGTFTPKCDLEHKFKCGGGNGPSTTESSTSSESIQVVKHDDQACDATPVPANPLYPGTSGSWTNELISYEGLDDDGNQQAKFATGTYKDTQADESFTANGDPQVGDCGAELSPNTGGNWGSVTVTIGFNYGAAQGSIGYTTPTYTPPSPIQAEDFKRIRFQKANRKVVLTGAKFTGSTWVQSISSGILGLPYGPKRDQQTHTSEGIAINSQPVSAGGTGGSCKNNCCPGNTPS